MKRLTIQLEPPAGSRITDAELRVLEDVLDGRAYYGIMRMLTTMRALVAEVRRLRALIASLPRTATMQGMDAPGGITCELRQLVRALDDEARAIREENTHPNTDPETAVQ